MRKSLCHRRPKMERLKRPPSRPKNWRASWKAVTSAHGSHAATSLQRTNGQALVCLHPLLFKTGGRYCVQFRGRVFSRHRSCAHGSRCRRVASVIHRDIPCDTGSSHRRSGKASARVGSRTTVPLAREKPGARLVKLALFWPVVSLGAVLLLTGCLFLAVIEVHAVSSGKIRTSQINGFSWV